MALYVIYEDDTEIEWHMGKVIPSGFQNVKMVQADGHELDYIQKQYSMNNNYSIPMPNQRVVRWCGDIAKTIIANM